MWIYYIHKMYILIHSFLTLGFHLPRGRLDFYDCLNSCTPTILDYVSKKTLPITSMEGINPNVGANNGSNSGGNGINNMGPTNGNNIGMTTTMYATQPFLLFMASLNLLDLSQPIIYPLLHDFSWPTCQLKFSKISPSLRVIQEKTPLTTFEPSTCVALPTP